MTEVEENKRSVENLWNNYIDENPNNKNTYFLLFL